MRIAFFEVESWEEEVLKEQLRLHSLSFCSGKLDKHNAHLYRDVEAIGIFIYSHIDKTILDKLSKLRFITTLSTGYDHIDLEECKKRKILVSNVPFYG